MPTSGWYDDPEQPWTWRYWDGARWTDHRAPMWVPPHSDPTSLSSWFERSVEAGKVAVRRVGVVLVALWLLIGASGWWLVVASFDSARGRELRELFEADGNPVGPPGSAALTDAEAERAWELLQDMFWSAAPWLVLLVLVAFVAWAWSVAFVVLAVQSAPVQSTDRSAAPERHLGLAGEMGAAIRRTPVVVGSVIVVVATQVTGWVVGAFPVIFVALAGGGATAVALTLIFVGPLLLGVTVWLWGRLTLATVIAATGGHGIGVRRSWHLTQGRYWSAAARLMVTALVAGVAGGVANAVSGFGPLLGWAVFLAILTVLQALAFGVSIVITTCGHLAAVEQLAVGRPQ